MPQDLDYFSGVSIGKEAAQAQVRVPPAPRGPLRPRAPWSGLRVGGPKGSVLWRTAPKLRPLGQNTG